MTSLAAKKSHIGAKRQPGRVVRNAGGVSIVEYATGIVDNGAPEYFVTHLCRVEKIGPGTVRISWGCQQENGEIWVMYKAIMDLKIWLAAQRPIDNARATIARLPPDGEKRESRKETH